MSIRMSGSAWTTSATGERSDVSFCMFRQRNRKEVPVGSCQPSRCVRLRRITRGRVFFSIRGRRSSSMMAEKARSVSPAFGERSTWPALAVFFPRHLLSCRDWAYVHCFAMTLPWPPRAPARVETNASRLSGTARSFPIAASVCPMHGEARAELHGHTGRIRSDAESVPDRHQSPLAFCISLP
jgi:hypothetical protein